MEQNSDLVLLFGATGRVGIRVAQYLLQQGIPTKIVVRKPTEISKIFDGNQKSFQQIIQIPNFLSQEGKRQLDKAFKGGVTSVISALGQNFKGSKTHESEFQIIKQIIDLSKSNSVKKFVFCSSALITKILHPFPIVLDTFTDVYQFKAKAENYLRKSGLNYVIIRPGGLKGDFNLKEYGPTNYRLYQGDNAGGGRVHRSTVARLMVDSLRSKTLKNNVTFQVKSSDGNLMNQPYENPEHSFQKLRQDTEKDIVTANHKLPRYFVLAIILIAAGYLLIA